MYAPNVDDAEFMATLLSTIPNMETHHFIFGGDPCNEHSAGSLNPQSDRAIKNGNNTTVIYWRIMEVVTRGDSYMMTPEPTHSTHMYIMPTQG